MSARRGETDGWHSLRGHPDELAGWLRWVLLVLTIAVCGLSLWKEWWSNRSWGALVLIVAWTLAGITIWKWGRAWIRQVAYQHRRRDLVVFTISVLLTWWIWGLGVFGTSVIAAFLGSGWKFPWDPILNHSLVVGSLLGAATIFALVIAFCEIRTLLQPKALDFGEALLRCSDFIKEHNSDNGYTIWLCAAYPSIGAVNANKGGYMPEFLEFCEHLSKHRPRCLCLQLATPVPVGAQNLKQVGEGLVGHRPHSIEEAVAAFTSMYFLEANGTASAEAMDTFETAIGDINHWTMNVRKYGGQVKHVATVPDFHFLLALRKETPEAGFVLIPFRPAGMPNLGGRPGATVSPPMMGVEVHDPSILAALLRLYKDLEEQAVG